MKSPTTSVIKNVSPKLGVTNSCTWATLTLSKNFPPVPAEGLNFKDSTLPTDTDLEFAFASIVPINQNLAFGISGPIITHLKNPSLLMR